MAEEIEIESKKSSELDNGPVPSHQPNDLEELLFTKDGLVYDPSYILKFKGPTLHTILDRINQLASAVTSLQMVVTNLIEEETETREIIDEMWKDYVKPCKDQHGISKEITDWDGEGVVEEGVDPYKCTITIEE